MRVNLPAAKVAVELGCPWILTTAAPHGWCAMRRRGSNAGAQRIHGR